MEDPVAQKRIIFMGTPEFAVGSLDALLRAGIRVSAVVTAPDRPAGRGRQLRMSAVKRHAIEHGLPVLQPEKLRDPAFLEALDGHAADLLAVVAFRMLPAAVWQRPRLGTINLHASLLPSYRGAAPINWAIINGERVTGATTFFIREEIDTGDIIDQVQVGIGPEENAGQLHDRLMTAGAALLVRTVQQVLRGTHSSHPQSTGTLPLPTAPKLTTEGCRIDWTAAAAKVHDHIRGLSPHPGAWTRLRFGDGRTIHFKVLAGRPADATLPPFPPGSVHDSAGRLLIHCRDGCLEALDVQPEGKRRMTAAEFLRGAGQLDGACCL